MVVDGVFRGEHGPNGDGYYTRVKAGKSNCNEEAWRPAMLSLPQLLPGARMDHARPVAAQVGRGHVSWC